MRGSAGRSAIWRVFARRGREDVYVTNPEFGSGLKVSLHESGACHAAFRDIEERGRAESGWAADVASVELPTHLAARPDAGRGRFTEQWTARETMPGLQMPLHVSIPADGLCPMPDHPSVLRRVKWIAATPAGTAAVVSVALTNRPTPSGRWPGQSDPGTTYVDHFSFPSGRTVWLLGVIKVLDQSGKEWLAGCAREPIPQERLLAAEREGKEVTRIVVPCLDEAGGVLALWDLANESQ